MMPRRRFEGKCSVADCNDFVYVQRSGLCQVHYHRFRETGSTEKLQVLSKCAECGKPLRLEGSAAKVQRYCSEKCRGKFKRRRSPSNPDYKYRWKLGRQYGITLEDFCALVEYQNGCCAICGRSEYDIGERFCVDHDHTTGVVRGALCRRCNKALGGFRDSIEILLKAVDYLKKHK